MSSTPGRTAATDDLAPIPSPDALRARITAADESSIRELRSAIRGRIEAQWQGDDASVVEYTVPETYSRRVSDVVCAELRAAGWSVKYNAEAPSNARALEIRSQSNTQR